MDIRDVAQAELEALTGRLLQNLKAGAGKHKLARYHVDLDNSPDQSELDSLSYRGGMLSTDPAADGKPFVKGEVDKEVRAVLGAGLRDGRPIYLLQYDFSRRSSEWRYEFKAQSREEYRQLCAERRGLEDALEPLLLIAAKAEMRDWKKVMLDFDSMTRKLRVIVSEPNFVFKDAAVADEVRRGFETIKGVYAARGFALGAYSFAILGGPKRKAREVTDYYV